MNLSECSVEEMAICAEEISQYVPLLERLRAQNVTAEQIRLPYPSKVRAYLAGLLVRCDQHTHALRELGDR